MSGLRRPLVLPRPTYYDSTSDYHSIDDSLNRVEYFSNAVLEDQYDAALRSRGRDDALLRNANATIEESSVQQSEVQVQEASESTQAVCESAEASCESAQAVCKSAEAEATCESAEAVCESAEAACESAETPSNMYIIGPSMMTPSLKSLSMYSDLLSLTTDRPTPSLQLEGVYYRPVVSTSGLHASRPPMMTSNLSAAGHQQAIKDSEAVIAASNASNNASSAEDAKNMGGTVNIPRYYACGGDPLNRPVTELRRKMRRMVAQGKRNPNYYRMGLDD